MANDYYARTADFLPGATILDTDVEDELDAVEAGFDLLQEDIDNAIKLTNADVTTDQVISGNAAARASKLVGFDSTGALGLVTKGEVKGNWATSTAYIVGDIVKDAAGALSQNSYYICITAHTSSALASESAYWSLMVDVEACETAQAAAEAAQADAETAQAAAEAAQADAETAQTAAEVAQTAAEAAQTGAETAQTAAEAAQTAAETAYDNFDDRYLGQKASDPTLDNDGNALLTGALYFNTASNIMKVYTGSAWAAAYVDAGTYVLGPASATDNNLATFDGTTGKLIQDSGVALPTGALVGTTDSQTLSNKTIGAATLSGTLSCADNTVSRPILLDYAETTNAIGSIGGGTQDIDLTAGNCVTATVDTSATTFTFSNPTASDDHCGFVLYLTNGGSQTVTWPASVDWAGGTAPDLTASGLDILVFSTVDGGTTWFGNVVGQDMQ